MNFTDPFMLVTTLVTICFAALYAKRYHNYVVASWIYPLAWLAYYYFLLIFDPEVAASVHLRMDIFRPAFWSFIALVTLFLANGRINKMIDGVISLWLRFLKPKSL